MSDKIIGTIDGAIGRIVFNNPAKRNAVSLDMWLAVDAALERFAAEPSLRVLVLAGAGGKAFVSGADVSKFEDERAGAEAVERYSRTTAGVYDKLAAFPKPVIAQIAGWCVGGGVALATCCDLRVCGEGSRFAVPAARLGLGYGFDGVRRLVALVGPAFAKEILFTARRFDAREAHAMGLVNRVVPDGEVADICTAMAERIAGNAPLTVGAAKFAVGEVMKDESARDIRHCVELVAACYASEDYAEGRRAFMEKRVPRFTGR